MTSWQVDLDELAHEAPDVGLRQEDAGALRAGQRGAASRLVRARANRGDHVAGGGRRKREKAAGWRARDGVANASSIVGVEQDTEELGASAGEPERGRAPQLSAHELGEVERILLGRGDAWRAPRGWRADRGC